MKEKDKNRKLDYFSENLAVPEIHVDTLKHSAANDEEQDSCGDVVFENLAIPEVKLKNPAKHKE